MTACLSVVSHPTPADRRHRLGRDVRSFLHALAAAVGVALGLDWTELTHRP